MIYSLSLSLSLLFLFVSLSSCVDSRVFLEPDVKVGVVPPGWKVVGEARENDRITLLIGFRPQNREEITSLLYELATPSSPKYGQWLNKKDVDDLLRPSRSIRRSVLSWLATEYTEEDECTLQWRGALWLEFQCTVAVAQRLLDVSFSYFINESGEKWIRTLDKYSVPSELSPYLTIVGNTIRLPKPQTNIQKQMHPAAPYAFTTTPESIQKRYNVQVPPPNATNLQAVVSFLGQYYASSDLSLFESAFGFPTGACQIATTIGANNQSAPGIEASLDVQYLQFGNCTIETWDYSIAGNTHSGNEPFLNWLTLLDAECSTKRCPYVYSISYQDYENTVSQSYAEAVDIEFEILSLSGRTFFSGSGDWGVGCRDIGYGDSSYSCTEFNPDFISSSPYVVSLGSTTLKSPTNEVGVGYSSGGFSNYFRRPAYQNNAINKYFSQGQGIPPTSFFNKNGRGFPDLAVIGVNFRVFWNGIEIPVDGTSASTPTFAAMISMMNTLRFNAGLPSMGFVHPFLYQIWDHDLGAYRDIIENDTQQHGCCPVGFAAVPGWEPMCGLGVPDYGVMSSLALSSRVFPSLFKK